MCRQSRTLPQGPERKTNVVKRHAYSSHKPASNPTAMHDADSNLDKPCNFTSARHRMA